MNDSNSRQTEERRTSSLNIPPKDAMKVINTLCGTAIIITILILSYLSGLMEWALILIGIVAFIYFVLKSEGDL